MKSLLIKGFFFSLGLFFMGLPASGASGAEEDGDGIGTVRAPTELTGLTTGGKYINSIPVARVPDNGYGHSGHSATSMGHLYGTAEALEDLGGWAYDPTTGTVRVDCTDDDSRGTPWASN